MRSLKIFILGILTFASVQAYGQKKKMETVEIKTSAVCDMCKDKIESTLSFEKGVKKSVLNLKTMVVKVTYDPAKTTPDALRKAISLAGYDADEVMADETAYNNLDECCKKGAKCEH